jgi:hypothetical protein
MLGHKVDKGGWSYTAASSTVNCKQLGTELRNCKERQTVARDAGCGWALQYGLLLGSKETRDVLQL